MSNERESNLSTPEAATAAPSWRHHTLTVARNSLGRANLTVTCSAPVGAWCRMHCPDGCEEWGPEPIDDYGHTLVDYGQCLAVEWLDACEYAGYADEEDPTEPFVDGPVRVYYEDGWCFEMVSSLAAGRPTT